MIHFALVQLSKKHTEIFGTFIEIINYYNWELTIYYDKDDDPYTFINYYIKLFETTLNILPTSQLEDDKKKYDYFIFTTSSDELYIPEYFKTPEMSNRCIFVNHQASYCLPFMKKNIQMSPIIQIEDKSKLLSCIIPFYRQYKKIHSKYNSSNLAIIGAIRPHQKDKDLKLLVNLLKTPNLKLNIYIFMRKIDWRVISNHYKFMKNHPNIKFFPGLSTNEMIEKLREVKFILPLSKQDGWFYWQRLTGTIPLAINLNIPLIMDKKLSKIYNLDNCGLLYETEITEILESIMTISEEDYYKMVENIVIYKKKQASNNRKQFLDLCMAKSAYSS
jgi:hypothetical protein